MSNAAQTNSPIDMFTVRLSKVTQKMATAVESVGCSIDTRGMVQAPWCWSSAMVEVTYNYLINALCGARQ